MEKKMYNEKFRQTTILCVKKDKKIVIAGDGQVSAGPTILKGNVVKVRKIYNDKIAVGFAGSTADAFTLMERLDSKLQGYGGNLLRSAVELAKDWRTDKFLRRLEAMMIATDGNQILLVTGNGDVIEPEEDVIGIGSGGNYAMSAARALLRKTDLPVEEIVRESLKIAGEVCVYTNQHHTVIEMEAS
jgi:ATP-dependent HslUV protease, peptidase subunit HslV